MCRRHYLKLSVALSFVQAMVTCQMLSELEEVIQYKLVPERREIIRQTWWDRLQVSSVVVYNHYYGLLIEKI